ncbi:MAG: NAD(P)H-hydrate epimerase, partial [Anaerotignaceae bacterium]
MKVATGTQMKEIDRLTIEKTGIQGIVLMENASQGVADRVILAIKENNFKTVSVFCGTGNNGGDGFAVARILHNKGIDVKIHVVGNVEKIKGDALINYDVAKNISIPFEKDFT